jgi:hypothetical protein
MPTKVTIQSVRAQAPDVSVLEAAIPTPDAAARSAIATAKAAALRAASWTPARKALYLARVQRAQTQRVLASVWRRDLKNEAIAQAIEAATTLADILTASRLDPTRIAVAESQSLDAMIVDIANRCPSRDVHLLAAINAVSDSVVAEEG